ncbi:MAG: CVNH domain-containing protein [Micropepsaceae bacterium]
MRVGTAIAFCVAGILSLAASASADVIPPGSYQRTCSDFYTDGTTLSATCRTRWGGENYTTLRNYNDCEGDIANVHGRLQCVDDDDDDDNWIPRGSYRATCRDVNVEDGTLQAECKDRNGRWRYTELQSFRSCRGDIANVNGMLRCRRDEDDDDYNLPGGNWRSSCRNYRVSGWTLTAECRDLIGNWRRTSIDLRQCDGDVSNRRGRLVCAQDAGYGRITLYSRDSYGGKSRMYTTDVPDLNAFGFGNEASSVVVQGGVWQLCDRPNYRGFCIMLDRSVSNLYVYGFNDRTESVRRIR